jgi:menaquinone-dependent protoporphyrinogen oxidase
LTKLPRGTSMITSTSIAWSIALRLTQVGAAGKRYARRTLRCRHDMAEILIVYSTVDGHTRKICRRLQQVIERRSHRVTLREIDDPSPLDWAAYDKVVVGASIRYGKHPERVYRFVTQHGAALDAKPNAFFTVNVVARKPEKCEPDTNPYMKKFLRQIAWKPKALAVFAGRIDYSLYRFWDRQTIRFIMFLTKGPTDLSTSVEFTNWDRVDAFGEFVAGM